MCCKAWDNTGGWFATFSILPLLSQFAKKAFANANVSVISLSLSLSVRAGLLTLLFDVVSRRWVLPLHETCAPMSAVRG